MKYVILLSGFLCSQVFARDIGPIGVFSSYSQTASTQTTSISTLEYTFSPSTTFGGGLVSIHPINSLFEFEVRAIYLSEPIKGSYAGTVSDEATTGTITYNAPYVQVPLLLNLCLTQNFALHVGGFYAFSVGHATPLIAVNVGGSSTTSNSMSITPSDDYGLVGGIEFKTDLSTGVEFILSGDYDYGLADLVNSDATASHSRAVQMIAGFLFHL